MTAIISDIFVNGHNKTIEQNIMELINNQGNWLSKEVVKSTRAVGDSIEDIISNNFEGLVGNEYCKSYSGDFARRAMADFAFEDHSGNYHVIDVKTHRIDTKFNMPNLISVERLSKFYQSDKNHFVLLFLSYEIIELSVVVLEAKFIPIEFLDWSCLTIGALGWGQIQVANSNNIVLQKNPNRVEWMIELCDILSDYYPREISKVQTRLEHFKRIKEYWIAKKIKEA